MVKAYASIFMSDLFDYYQTSWLIKGMLCHSTPSNHTEALPPFLSEDKSSVNFTVQQQRKIRLRILVTMVSET